MIYLDNAASGGFKPYASKEVAINVTKNLNVNPTRSGHKLAETGGRLVFETRKALCDFFGGYSTERTVFTKNCTEALNLAILGVLKPDDEVVTTCIEHNSVLRPLKFLEAERRVKIHIAFPEKCLFSRKNTIIRYSDVRPFLSKKTKLVIICRASNVNGSDADANEIAANLKKEFPETLLLIDGAQSGGHERFDMKGTGADMLALACHKGLGAVGASGALLFSDRCEISPLTFGGTGSDSFSVQPDYYPDKLESGTLNLPSIASLFEGILHLKHTLDFNIFRLNTLTKETIDGLKNIRGVKIYSLPNPFGIVAFSIENLPSVVAAERLSDEFGIAVRGGFHCAPLMHKYLGTEKEGLIRASFAPENTSKEAEKLCEAVKILAEKA
ncbi:MAG: aminotransferase class V-fold PLP-dependent enzyme [Christensenellaceae bacterium]|nr:aminotransferase class V-fold PLP-dependent enzyme [Christensenellaceae bacterium]MDD6927112.1 aminotransferase class V-fold PLP-dependent enzyme [bacterium]